MMANFPGIERELRLYLISCDQLLLRMVASGILLHRMSWMLPHDRRPTHTSPCPSLRAYTDASACCYTYCTGSPYMCRSVHAGQLHHLTVHMSGPALTYNCPVIV